MAFYDVHPVGRQLNSWPPCLASPLSEWRWNCAERRKTSFFHRCSSDRPLSLRSSWFEGKGHACRYGDFFLYGLWWGSTVHLIHWLLKPSRGLWLELWGPWAWPRTTACHVVDVSEFLNCCFFTWEVPQCSPSGTVDHGPLLTDNQIIRCGTQWQIQVYLILVWEVSVADVILLSIKSNTNRRYP